MVSRDCGNSIKLKKINKMQRKWSLARLGRVQNPLKFNEILRISTKTLRENNKKLKIHFQKLENPEKPLKTNLFPN